MSPLLILAVVVFALGGKSSSPTAPPQQTTTPPATQPGQSTGQVVADIAQTALDLFQKYLNQQD